MFSLYCYDAVMPNTRLDEHLKEKPDTAPDTCALSTALEAFANCVVSSLVQGGSTDLAYDSGRGVAIGFDGGIVLAGSTSGTWDESIGELDFAVVMLIEDSTPTPAPSMASSTALSSSTAPSPDTPTGQTSAPITPSPATVDGEPNSTIVIVGAVCAAVVVFIAGVGVWRWHRTGRQKKPKSSPLPRGFSEPAIDRGLGPGLIEITATQQDVEGMPSPPLYAELFDGDVGSIMAPDLAVTSSTADNSTTEIQDFPPLNAGDDPVEKNAPVAASGSSTSKAANGRASSNGAGVGQAVMEAAQNLAEHSGIPGVAEAATLLSILVNLVMNNRSSINAADKRIKWCRSVVNMIQRAEKVLGEVRRCGKCNLRRVPCDGSKC